MTNWDSLGLYTAYSDCEHACLALQGKNSPSFRAEGSGLGIKDSEIRL